MLFLSFSSLLFISTSPTMSEQRIYYEYRVFDSDCLVLKDQEEIDIEEGIEIESTFNPFFSWKGPYEQDENKVIAKIKDTSLKDVENQDEIEFELCREDYSCYSDDGDDTVEVILISCIVTFKEIHRKDFCKITQSHERYGTDE
ncbi:hypothetical protein BX667DRAFT_525558 [Coemansia mojavensis]|nr:hypothetical protein BX667DRAFT_525558 [Coemansia mojavensis]